MATMGGGIWQAIKPQNSHIVLFCSKALIAAYIMTVISFYTTEVILTSIKCLDYLFYKGMDERLEINREVKKIHISDRQDFGKGLKNIKQCAGGGT